MDAGYISALFGIAGATVGGLTSFLTTWLTQKAQLRDKHREAVAAKRQDLISAFIVEASRLYGDALGHEKNDVSDLVQLYAMIANIRLWASRPVVDAAEQAMEVIISTYLEPNRTLREISEMAAKGKINFLLDFGEQCRREIANG